MIQVMTGALVVGMALTGTVTQMASADTVQKSKTTIITKAPQRLASESYNFSFSDTGAISTETLAKYKLDVFKNLSGYYGAYAISANNSMRVTGGNVINTTVLNAGTHTFTLYNPTMTGGMDTSKLTAFVEYTDGFSEFLTPNISVSSNKLIITDKTDKPGKFGFSISGTGNNGGLSFTGYEVN